MSKNVFITKHLDHKNKVNENIATLINELKNRGIAHDNSKMDKIELDVFVEYDQKLRNVEYGSDQYKLYLKEMKPALDSHYQKNRHHPEHFVNGISDMNIIDLSEMLCDWIAVAESKGGDIYKSIEINQKRFNFSDDVRSILLNTIDLLSMK